MAATSTNISPSYKFRCRGTEFSVLSPKFPPLSCHIPEYRSCLSHGVWSGGWAAEPAAADSDALCNIPQQPGMDDTVCRSAPDGAYTPQSPHHICPDDRKKQTGRWALQIPYQSLCSLVTHEWGMLPDSRKSPETRSEEWLSWRQAIQSASHIAHQASIYQKRHISTHRKLLLFLWESPICGQFSYSQFCCFCSHLMNTDDKTEN